jgi:DNA-directed RNA polymerase subunit delta
MSSVKSRIAYLRGLMDGLGIKDDSKESRVMIEIVNVLDEISEKVEAIEDSQSEFEDYLNSISEDLNDIEDDFYDECDDEDCNFDDFIELECSNCNETVYVEEDMLEGHQCIKCPNCQNVLINENTEIEEKNND